jgi:hypothetical protein
MTLDGAIAKVGRAKHHYDALAEDIRSFREADAYSVVLTRPTSELLVVSVQTKVVPPHERWSLILGDCVHALRCSLDYIAWEGSGANPNDRSTQFPIFETQAGWLDRGLKKIQKVTDPGLSDYIEKAQPYHTKDPRLTPLNVLRILDDSDKHKLLTVTVTTAQRLFLRGASEVQPPPESIRANFIKNPTLENGAILATFVGAGLGVEATMDGKVEPTVVLGDNLGLGERVDVLLCLEVMISEVEAVIDQVRPFFQ